MKHKACLVITHGTTDLQLLLHDPNDKTKLLRAAPEKSLVRGWHEYLQCELKENRACVVDLPSNLKERNHEATITKFDNDIYTLRLDGSSIQASPARNHEGKLQLVLPKIQPALSDWFESHAKQAADKANKAAAANNQMAAAFQSGGVGKNKATIERVLVLSTDRGPENQQGANRSSNNQEPIATPDFLKQWFIGKYQLSKEKVHATDYLGVGEDLEGKSGKKRVGHIGPDIARRLEDVLYIFYPPGSEELLLLAHEGGLPKVKELLDEYAAMLAPGRNERLGSPERGDAGVLGLTPIDALRTRRICLEHVRRGNLLDAYACAAPFYNEKSAKTWVQPLEQAASLINGNPIGSVGSAATLPALQRIIDNAKKAPCLLVAVRVESALLGQRWIEAFIGSTTFLDVALHYALLAWEKEYAEKINTHRNEIWLKKDPSLDLIEAGALIDRRTPTHKNRYEYNLSNKKAQECWCQAFNIKELEALFYTIYPSSGRKLSDYRNTATHEVMKQGEVREAIEAFTTAKLWYENLKNYLNSPKPKDEAANQYPAPGECFLDRELIKAVLQHFLPGIKPAKLYTALLQELEQRLIQPPQAQGSETRANAAP